MGQFILVFPTLLNWLLERSVKATLTGNSRLGGTFSILKSGVLMRIGLYQSERLSLHHRACRDGPTIT